MLKALLEKQPVITATPPVDNGSITASASSTAFPPNDGTKERADDFKVGSPRSYTNNVLARGAQGNKDTSWVVAEFARIAAAKTPTSTSKTGK